MSTGGHHAHGAAPRSLRARLNEFGERNASWIPRANRAMFWAVLTCAALLASLGDTFHGAAIAAAALGMRASESVYNATSKVHDPTD